MSNQVKVKILNEGAPSIVGGYVDLLNFQPENFLIGDTAGFDPLATETQPRGNVTYIGHKSNVKFKTVDSDKSLKIMLVIPEEANDIVIGNIMLYSYLNGSIKPTVMIVFSEQVIKHNPTSDITDRLYKYPGNRMVINISVTYVDIDKYDADYSFTVLTPNFANLPFFGLDADVPNAPENPHSQFVVNEMETLGNLPAFITKDTDNDKYFASPLFQNVASPKFGVLNGFDSDLVEGNRVRWIWGQLYTTNNDHFNGTVGGISYEADTTNAIVLGGLSY